MKVLNISGGGTKIVGEYGSLEVLLVEHKWKPDVVTGISAGAILALPAAMGLLPSIKETLLNLKPKDFFKVLPVRANGKLSFLAYCRLLLGKPSLGDFSNLDKLVKKHISRERFQDWQNDPDSPDAVIGTVSFNTGEITYWNLKDLDYEQAVLTVRASASIPVYCQPVDLFHSDEGRYEKHFDGGVRDHIGTVWAFEEYGSTITEMYNIYAKPLSRTLRYSRERADKILSVFNTAITLLENEVSNSDSDVADLIQDKFGTDMRDVYVPVVLDHVYDVDPERLRIIYEAGRRAMRYAIDPVK